MKAIPRFPPLLSGHRVLEGKDPVKQALARLAKDGLGAGDLLWLEDRRNMRFAVVLEPEVERDRCGEMVYLLMVAFGDAAGAISMPEIAINYKWPSELLVNEARVGSVGLRLSDSDQNGVPSWMVLNIDVAISPETAQLNTGENADQTTMRDEGCGDISRTELLESVSRHMVNWIHTWSEEGFRPVHEKWMERLSQNEKLQSIFGSSEFLGMDERGNALIKTEDETSILTTIEALKLLSDNPVRSS